MNTAAPRPHSNHVLNIEMDDTGALLQKRELIAHAFRLSRASQQHFAKLMGIHKRTLTKYLAGTLRPTPVSAAAAVFAAICSGVAMHLPWPGGAP